MFYKSKPIEYQEWLPWAHVVGNEDDRVAMEFHDLALLKADLVKQQKQIAYDLLFKSDWKVVRAQELETTVPENITTYRAAVRSAADARCTQINAVSSVEELKTLIELPSVFVTAGNPKDLSYVREETQIEGALTKWPTEVN